MWCKCGCCDWRRKLEETALMMRCDRLEHHLRAAVIRSQLDVLMTRRPKESFSSNRSPAIPSFLATSAKNDFVSANHTSVSPLCGSFVVKCIHGPVSDHHAYFSSNLNPAIPPFLASTAKNVAFSTNHNLFSLHQCVFLNSYMLLINRHLSHAIQLHEHHLEGGECSCSRPLYAHVA